MNTDPDQAYDVEKADAVQQESEDRQLTHLSTIQSWPLDQLQSAFTQREAQLHKAMEEVEELRRQLAEFNEALQRERSAEWEKWANDLADRLENPPADRTVAIDDARAAARELRYMATSFTLKANFVPYKLKIQEWWWKIPNYYGIRDDMESFMREHNIALEKPEGL